MEQSINIYPVLATWKKSKKDGRCPIHLSIDINNKRAAFPSLKRKILPEEWDAVTRKVKPGVPNYILINAAIKKRADELDAQYMRKQLNGITLNKAIVKKVAKNNGSDADFYTFCRERIAEYKNDETKRTYRSEVTKLEQHAPALGFQDIDYPFLAGYESYMNEELENAANTVFKSFKFMNTMIIKAMGPSFKMIAANPFDEYDRGKYEEGIPPYLEWEEVMKLFAFMKTRIGLDKSQAAVGWSFLLSCFSGLRFSDVIRFTPETFIISSAGGKRLQLYTTKGKGEIVSISFTSYIAEVVNMLSVNPLPAMSNKDFNLHLKVIGGIALQRGLKSHMGRHSFAIHCAEIGMSVDDVQKLLGHKDRRSTMIYFKIKNPRLDREMEKWDATDNTHSPAPSSHDKTLPVTG